jgi:adenylate cyclase
MSSPYLEWIDENNKSRRLDIVDRVFIGRTCMGIDDTRRIILKHPAVSRDHVEISLTGAKPVLRDLSKNGTWVNNVRLAAGSTKPLEDGDVVGLGQTQIHLRCPYRQVVENEEMESSQTLVRPREVIVTNVVADVRGFCSISQMEESYRVYELMKEIIQTFCAIVNDHKGTVKDYTGDEVYAFWEHGRYLSKEQAVAACLTAVEQAQTVAQIRAKLSGVNPAVESLRLGWGITTGKVTMSHYGWRVTDLTLVGDSTNSAFRLSSMANKQLMSEIVMCSQTAELVGESLPTDDLGLVTLRGRYGQEHVYGIGRESNYSESRLIYGPSFDGNRFSLTESPETIH